jgi:signal transduction histidine kinase
MDPSRIPGVARGLPDLATLTGVRSGKRTYYRELQRSNERLERTVAAMDAISRALVRTAEGPRTLIEEVVRVAADHLQASWMVIGLRDGELPDSRPRFLAVDPTGEVHDSLARLPAAPRAEVRAIRTGVDAEGETQEWVRVPMLLDGARVGGLAGLPGEHVDLEDADRSVLRILANQAAVSMHTTELHRAGLSLRRRAQQLYDEVSTQAQILAIRTEELRTAEQRLRVADQRELLDNERRRIALELHDSVAQTVLTAGLSVDVLRSDAERLPGAQRLARELGQTRDMMVTATEQLRSVIYALHHARVADDVASLPELLGEMAAQHRPHLTVALRIEGVPIPIGTAVEHALARTAGEALFNVTMHAHASRAQVRLRYLPDRITLRISDDGCGDPAAMRRTLRVARSTTADGRHRGVVGMAMRAEGLGGSFAVRRSRMGGVCIESIVPMGVST